MKLKSRVSDNLEALKFRMEALPSGDGGGNSLTLLSARTSRTTHRASFNYHPPSSFMHDGGPFKQDYDCMWASMPRRSTSTIRNRGRFIADEDGMMKCIVNVSSIIPLLKGHCFSRTCKSSQKGSDSFRLLLDAAPVQGPLRADFLGICLYWSVRAQETSGMHGVHLQHQGPRDSPQSGCSSLETPRSWDANVSCTSQLLPSPPMLHPHPPMLHPHPPSTNQPPPSFIPTPPATATATSAPFPGKSTRLVHPGQLCTTS